MSKMVTSNAQQIVNEVSDNDSTLEKKQAFQLLQFTQSSEFYERLTQKIAGGLYNEILAVFPKHLQIIYSITDSKERKLWNAVIAKRSLDDGIESLEADSPDLMQTLLFRSSKELLKEEYDQADSLFTLLLYKTPESAMDADVYQKLYELSVSSESVRSQLKKVKSITANVIRWLYELPKELKYINIAKSVSQESQVNRLAELIKLVGDRSTDSDKQAALKTIGFKARFGPVKPSWIAEQILDVLSFDAPVIPDSEHVRYIRNKRELTKLSERYENCLAHHGGSAASGASQYYEWTLGQNVVVQIRKRYGQWCIDEMKCRKNEEPRSGVVLNIREHFARFDVSTEDNFYIIANEIRKSESDYDPDDDLLEELLEDLL